MKKRKRLFQRKHFADIYQIKNYLNLRENMTAGCLPHLSIIRYLLSVPAVNSVPESAGCPCAHQRRLPPTPPVFPRSPPLSGPHPQPRGPCPVSPGPPCPRGPHLAAAVTMATAGSGAGNFLPASAPP